jgi:hypothetical protein
MRCGALARELLYDVFEDVRPLALVLGASIFRMPPFGVTSSACHTLRCVVQGVSIVVHYTIHSIERSKAELVRRAVFCQIPTVTPNYCKKCKPTKQLPSTHPPTFKTSEQHGPKWQPVQDGPLSETAPKCISNGRAFREATLDSIRRASETLKVQYGFSIGSTTHDHKCTFLAHFCTFVLSLVSSVKI